MRHAIRAIGALIGGAYGDSWGAAVEFMDNELIRRRYGSRGIQEPTPCYGRPHPVVTDGTQLAIATGLGILEYAARPRGDLRASVWRAYQQWFASQRAGRDYRAPGTTTLNALEGGVMGSIESPTNKSAASGGVERVSPVGIWTITTPDTAFSLGVEIAALTHGHPNAYVPAGVFAALIALLIRGVSFDEALEAALCILRSHIGEEARQGTEGAIRSALNAPLDTEIGRTARIIDEHVGTPGVGGGGWNGHDALAIAIYAVRAADGDPLRAGYIAVNHSGDSDTTGSIACAMMGAQYGPIPFLRLPSGEPMWIEHKRVLIELGIRLTRGRDHH